MPEETYICPSCDSSVRVGGICPKCGPPKLKPLKKPKAIKVARRPWEQDESMDGLDLPGDDFDYDEFVEREFGDKARRGTGIKWYWWVTGVVVLGWFAWLVFGGLG